MKIEHKEIVDGKIRITTTDERWYVEKMPDDSMLFFPSVTWICSYYPKGIEYMRWLASKGWDEAQMIRNEAATKGDRTHVACEMLTKGMEIKHNEVLLDKTSGEMREITSEEYYNVMTFCEWFKEAKPRVLATETTVYNKKFSYAGTQDLIAEINGEIWIIDIKTSPHVWPSMSLQLSAYSMADQAHHGAKTAVLQIGYKLNKKGFKFTPQPDKFEEFLAVRKIWLNECNNKKPLQREYPLSLKLPDGESKIDSQRSKKNAKI